MAQISTARWHLDYLDSLRGIAVLGVVLIHSHTLVGHTAPLPRACAYFVDSGARGVGLFFIASAFTLFLSHDNRKSECNPTMNFFIRRFFRLAPMLYIAILVVPFYVSESPRIMLLSALFLNGLHPNTIYTGALGSWSMADEALFYLCLPLLFAKIKNLRAAVAWLVIATPIAFVVSRLLARAYPQHNDYFRFYWFVGQFPIFLMGIVGYFLWKRSSKDNKRASLALMVAAGVLYAFLLPFTYKNFYAVGLVCLMLLLSLAFHPWHMLVNPVTRFLGRISYSIYLVHFYPCIYLHHLNVTFPVIVAGTLAVTIPVAYLSWRFVEEPGIALGRRIITRLELRDVLPVLR